MKLRWPDWILNCLLLIVFCGQAVAVRWLALATIDLDTNIKMPDQCEQLQGLVKRQRKICKRKVEMMDTVKYGAENAIAECQWQFENRRWNCSTVDPQKVFGRAVTRGTRESAFVHAISAAGVAHAVTKACSSGNLTTCGCDRSVRGLSAEGFQWSGCSDNVAYGTTFSKEFVDARDKSKKGNPKKLMNLHNNKAGRKTIEDNMRVECKCHGVSGSCEMKTCWRAMPSFREVGQLLKDKFDGATEVQQKSIGTRSYLIPLNVHFKPHTDADLVYLENSPDFCEPNPKIGSLGTTGRLCNRTSKALDGCELMCCGRGYVTKRRTVRERCECKFHWCCYVKCKECLNEIEEYFCL